MFRSSPVLFVLVLLLAGCAASRQPGAVSLALKNGGMVQSPSMRSVAEEGFGKPPWGLRGEFLLQGQPVRFERGAGRLAVFEALPTGVHTPLRLSWQWQGVESSAVCEGWTSETSANARLTASRPWVLSCRWGSAPAAMLQIGEGQMRRGKLSREGAYRRGELTLGLRSVHMLDSVVQPQAVAVGYEMLHQGAVVGSLDLSGPTPRLRRPDPAAPIGRAVTEAALVLALVSEL